MVCGSLYASLIVLIEETGKKGYSYNYQFHLKMDIQIQMILPSPSSFHPNEALYKGEGGFLTLDFEHHEYTEVKVWKGKSD